MVNARPPEPPPRDPISEVLHRYDPPLWLITARHAGRRGGLIATFAVRASIVSELPRMAVGIAKHHHTWGLIEGSGGFALHLLRTQDLAAVWRFGLATGHQADKLAGLPETFTPAGHPLYAQALAWLDCRVEACMDTGDRSLYLAEVTGGAPLDQGTALTVGTLLRDAPADRLEELDRLYRADQALDAAAILTWRTARRGAERPGPEAIS